MCWRVVPSLVSLSPPSSPSPSPLLYSPLSSSRFLRIISLSVYPFFLPLTPPRFFPFSPFSFAPSSTFSSSSPFLVHFVSPIFCSFPSPLLTFPFISSPIYPMFFLLPFSLFLPILFPFSLFLSILLPFSPFLPHFLPFSNLRPPPSSPWPLRLREHDGPGDDLRSRFRFPLAKRKKKRFE